MENNKFIVKNSKGLHARPAAQLVQLCGQFSSTILVKKGNSTIDGKSIIGVMGLGVGPGKEFEVIVEGDDEKQAMEAITMFIDTNL